MSVGPILSGRLPGSLATRQLHGNIQASTELINRFQNQVATGQKYFLPSESPASAIRAIGLQKLLEQNTQLTKNVQADSTFLEVTEGSMGVVNDALTKAKSFVIAGIGTASSPTEKEAMATELSSFISAALNAANATHNGRYLFGGSMADGPPFSIEPDGSVLYSGDDFSINSFTDQTQLTTNNVTGADAFKAFSDPLSTNVNPALTTNTKIADLLGGRGVPLGPVEITLDNGGTPQTEIIDLSNVETIGDIETVIEDAFAAGPLTVNVEVDPTSQSGLRFTPSAGTVAIADLVGTSVARDLGIASTAAAVITGGDLDPALTLQTNLADLNGGTGIGATSGNGLVITLGSESATVDLNGATTVEDALNLIRGTNLDIHASINDDGNGIAVRSRRSGVNFSIGENGGANAAGLGIRTFDETTVLSTLNKNTGVNVDGGVPLEIIRRDGTTVEVDLAGTKTVQDVLDAINAVDAGNLVASLNSVGNGISITDNSGTGPLTIPENTVSKGLGMIGSETGTDNTVALSGADPNPQDTHGVFAVLTGIQQALVAGDDAELTRLGDLVDEEIQRFTLERSSVGAKLQELATAEDRLADKRISLEESLSEELHTDLTEVLTQVTYTQTVLEATLSIAGSIQQLSLFNLL